MRPSKLATMHIPSRAALCALALVTALGSAGAAHAGRTVNSGPLTLYSAPMFTQTGNDLECAITSLTDTPLDVTIEIFGYVGYPLHQHGYTMDSVSTQLTQFASYRLVVTSDNTMLPMNCRFIVNGEASAVRASACTKSSTTLHACMPVQ
jgi:hypothetical protein